MKAEVLRCDYRGLPAVKIVAADNSSATLTLYGGHVLSWIPADGDERLFLSEKSAFTPGTPIRGGIPVIFPQFASRGPLPRHGFARTTDWRLIETKVDGMSALATLQLVDNASTRNLWPVSFAATIQIRVAPSCLQTTLAVDNLDIVPFAFTVALHTYLAVASIAQTQLEGLAGLRYNDSVAGNQITTQQTDALRIVSETDRIYFDAPRRLLLREPQRILEISSEGFPDVVVWNPWREKSAALPDMPEKGFTRMLCVEAAVIDEPARLAPGAQWQGTQQLTTVDR